MQDDSLAVLLDGKVPIPCRKDYERVERVGHDTQKRSEEGFGKKFDRFDGFVGIQVSAQVGSEIGVGNFGDQVCFMFRYRIEEKFSAIVFGLAERLAC